jgi:molecular chaperone Hsp33
MADWIRRWITNDYAFRILVADSRETVAEAIRVAGAHGEAAGHFGELVTGTALYGLAQAPADRVQCALQHDGTAGDLLADVWPGPTVRGRVTNPDPDDGPVLGADRRLSVSRIRANRPGELYQSVVPVPGGGLADAFQAFMLSSEQVLSFFALVTVLDDTGAVVRAGGMVVQALPEMRHEHLEGLTRALEQASFVDLVRAGDSPFSAAEALFGALGIAHLGDDPLAYSCKCSKEIALRAIRTLDAHEIDAIRAGGSETVVCDWCGASYVIRGEDLA